jgi:hypothetical protein
VGVPVATRTRKSRVAVGAAVGATLALLLGISILAAVLSQNGCLGGGSGATPSGRARHEIPADFLALYQQIGPRYGIPWPILAGIGKEECDHGRNPDPSCTPEPGAAGPGRANFAGAAGPMQLGIGGAAGCAFCAVKTDANDDGSAGTHDPADAIAMAAKLLIEEKGAPRNAPLDAYRPAVTAYNGSGSAADAYAARVLADARAYASGDFTRSGAGSCSSASLGVPGKVVIAPGANRPGVQLQPVLLQYVAAMAGIYGKPIVITTGTNHDRLTVDGNVSDHWDGHAADIGMSGNGGTDGGPVGDRIMTACLLVAGESPRRAASEARRGGLYTLHHAGLRIQCIWKTYEGGDHYTHVHVGVQRE